ncbi:sugar nucleotide-binding protein, partial [Rhizobium johnstonii]
SGSRIPYVLASLSPLRRELAGRFADQTGCPTSALDIADEILEIAYRIVADPEPSLRGIFHLTGSGEASWADFAEEIFTELSK